MRLVIDDQHQTGPSLPPTVTQQQIPTALPSQPPTLHPVRL